MKNMEELDDFIRHGHQYYMKEVTVDCVIFGYHDQELKILLAKYDYLNQWGIPAGYVKKEEKLSDAANRILNERTSLENIFLQQFYTFGDGTERLKSRNTKFIPLEFYEIYGTDNWLLQRTISVGYYALIEYHKATVIPDILYQEFTWHSVADLPDLIFESNETIGKALETMRNQMYLKPIGYNLLPEKFTLSEIHVLYETILNKKVDKRNFFNKLMALGIIMKLDEKRKIGNHRSPALYMFNQENYKEALNKGVAIAF